MTGIAGTVELLLPGFGSVVPPGTVTVAVLAAIVLGVVSGAVPVTTMVIELPPPAAMSTVVATLPAPLAVPQLALPAAVQVQVTAESWPGMVSATLAPTRFDGPALVTTIWYDTVPPAWTGVAVNRVLAIAASALGAVGVLEVELLLAGVGSAVVEVTVAVLLRLPVKFAASVPVIV